MPSRIKKETIEWFLNRKLNSFNYLKKLPVELIDRQITKLDYTPRINVPLWKHQKICFLIGTQQQTFYFLAKPGTGKTRTCMKIADYRLKPGEKLLFISPDAKNTKNVYDDFKRTAPHLTCALIYGGFYDSKEMYEEAQNADVLIFTYDSLQYLLSTRTDVIEVEPTHAIEFAKNFKMVVYDELTECSSMKTIAFKLCNILSNHIPYRYGLSGQPFGRNLTVLWPQFYLLDRGQSLGKNPVIFSQAFFKVEETKWGLKYSADDSKVPLLHRTLQNKSISFSDDECQKLPPFYTKIIKVGLTPEANYYYGIVKGDLVTSTWDAAFQAKIKGHFHKLRSICSGYLSVTDYEEDEDGNDIPVGKTGIWFDTEKDKWLKLLLTKIIPANEKVIIFYEFTVVGEKITKLLKSLGIDYIWIHGGISGRNQIKLIDRFNNDPNCKVDLMNTKSGNMGLNLQVSHVEIFYEFTVSPRAYLQAIKRIQRGEQEHDCYGYFLMTADTIEEKKIIPWYNKVKEYSDMILDGKNLSEVPADILGTITRKNLEESI